MTVITKNKAFALLTFLLMLVMVACSPAATPAETGGDVAAPTPETPATTPVVTDPMTPTEESGEGGTVGDADLEWNMSPDEVIAQYAITGGFRMRPLATELPQWTLYGDGTVVWTVEGDATTGFTNQVMVGQLTEDEMRALLTAVNSAGFWELEERYSEDGIADAANAIITVNLVNQAKQVVVYPAGRPDAPAAFNAVMQQFLSNQPANSVEFEATEFTFTADSLGQMTEMGADAQASFIEWTVDDVVLADSVNGQTVTAEQAADIQGFFAANGNVVQQDGVGYTVRLEGVAPRPVPGFTLS